MKAFIKTIEYYLPKTKLTNKQLSDEFLDLSADKIYNKTGISNRYIADKEECASDLGVKAAEKIFESGVCKPKDIDFLLFCTQSPDYFLPTSACIMQDRLGISSSTGALDFNLGCSGFIYGLGLAKALIETNQARNILIITAETYSKFIDSKDRSVRILFGDAGAATLIQGTKSIKADILGPFIYGTDGSGFQNLIVPAGGMRRRYDRLTRPDFEDKKDNVRSEGDLYMNGPELFNFSLKRVPEAVDKILKKAGKTKEDIDFFVFHQANKYMLNHLRKQIGISEEKFIIAIEDTGNTVSCSIPIAIKDILEKGKVETGDLLLLVGFGVGYSWGSTIVRWV